MFKRRQRLKTNDSWAQPYPKGGSLFRIIGFKDGISLVYFDVETFADIIIAEYCLREIVQREQTLKNKIRIIQKIGTPEDLKKQAEQNKQAREILRRYSEAEYNLYGAELRLPIGTVHKEYHSLRQSSTWYLRQELVDDCAKRGGCCSRNCGCCQTRHEQAVRNKGLGHCTPSCGCCASERGFEYSAKETQSFVNDLKARLYSDSPAYAVQMAEAFFLLPSVDTGLFRTIRKLWVNKK